MNEVVDLELFKKYVLSKGRLFNESVDNKRLIINNFFTEYDVSGGGVARELYERMYDALLIQQKKGM